MSEEQKRPPMSEAERDKLRKKRDLEYRKRMQEIKQAQTEEERDLIYDTIHAKHEAYEASLAIKPTTFQEKWDNYWYHHKFATWITLFAVLLAGLFVYDMVMKEEYDLTVMSVTQIANKSASYEELEQALSAYVVDDNGDHKQNVFIDAITLSDDLEQLDPDYHTGQVVRFQASIGGVEHIVYLMDQANYDYCAEVGIRFIDLSQYSDNPNIDGDKYYIRDDSDFESLENREQLMLLVRDVTYSTKPDDKNVKELFDKDLEAVKKIIAE